MKQEGLAPDMTSEEREINRKLVEELKERKINGGTDIFIGKGKICKVISHGKWKRVKGEILIAETAIK